MHQTRDAKDPSIGRFLNGKTVEAIPLTDYLKWASYSDGVAYPLSLPPIQRGFVWKPRQIADLWDSLLREMPIGSLMLQRHKGEDLVVPIPNSTEKVAIQPGKAGFHLLDGQQRTLAMLLGWRKGSQDPDHRLWVDLGEDGKNGARFMLRVTSRSQPFGFQRGTHEKLSRGDRKKAYEHHEKNHPEDRNKQFHELDLEVTRPWKAGTEKELLFVQLRDVWNVVRNESADKWEEIVATKLVGCELDETAKSRLQELCKALLKLKNAWIALVCVPTLHEPKNNDLDDPAHDPLTMLFERISTGGTRLSPEDLLFSIIKQAYPESHNFVYQIHKDVGTLLTAPDYVMTALRLACAIDSETQHVDNANPSAREFHRYLKDGKLLGNAQRPGPLRRMIMSNDSTSNPLVLSFKNLNDLLRYKSEPVHGTRDIGIPLAMFPYLNRPLVQVLVFWLVRLFVHGSPDPKLLEASRDDLVRFVLFWVFCNRRAKDAYDASKAAFEILRKHPISQPFPGRELYKRITEGGEGRDPSFVKIVYPEALNVLDLTPDPRLRTMEMRLKNIMGESNNGLRDLFSDFWWRKDLLLWLERDYVERKFCNYNFLAGRDERTEDSVPYDFDHLVPQAHWSDGRSSAKLDESMVGKEVKEAFKKGWIRNGLGNAIGNYRVVDSSENRSRGDEPLEDVLAIGEWKQDFAFDPNGEQLYWWLRASPRASKEERIMWGEERIKAFQAAIEHRTVALYKQYFDEAGFRVWLDGNPL
jgi:hypothetical protein